MFMVGAPGFEPGIAPSQTEYVSQLHHAPTINTTAKLYKEKVTRVVTKE